MKRFHARVAVVKALQDAGLYIETKDNPMQIPICRYVLFNLIPFNRSVNYQQIWRRYRANSKAAMVGGLQAFSRGGYQGRA